MLTSIVGERIFLAEEDAFCWGAWRWALAAESSSSMSRPRGTNSTERIGALKAQRLDAAVGDDFLD